MGIASKDQMDEIRVYGEGKLTSMLFHLNRDKVEALAREHGWNGVFPDGDIEPEVADSLAEPLFNGWQAMKSLPEKTPYYRAEGDIDIYLESYFLRGRNLGELATMADFCRHKGYIR